MDYDIVFIGCGVGGGAMALSPAPTGARILILKRGERFPRKPQNSDPEAVFVERRYRAKEPCVTTMARPSSRASITLSADTRSFAARPCSGCASATLKPSSMKTASLPLADPLLVVDASFFPPSAARNPALTIAAQGLRAGGRLTEH